MIVCKARQAGYAGVVLLSLVLLQSKDSCDHRNGTNIIDEDEDKKNYPGESYTPRVFFIHSFQLAVWSEPLPWVNWGE